MTCLAVFGDPILHYLQQFVRVMNFLHCRVHMLSQNVKMCSLISKCPWLLDKFGADCYTTLCSNLKLCSLGDRDFHKVNDSRYLAYSH